MPGPRGTVNWEDSLSYSGAGPLIGRNIGDATPVAPITDATSWTKLERPIARSTSAIGVGGTVGSYNTIYWPCVIRTDNIANPLGRYYLYYSTDHDATRGGIAMMYGPTPLGPFTNYGEVFVDLASQGGAGNGQTETPWVMWDPHNNNFRMFYQNRGAQYGANDSVNAIGSQSTLSATSTNGVTWTKDPNFILDIPGTNQIHGDGHTGYFCAFDTPNGMFAYSLCGGTSGPDFALWSCRGPLNEWTTDYRSMGYDSHFFSGESPERYVMWHNGFPVMSGGQLWWVGRLSDFSTFALTNSRIGVAPLSSDLRHVINKPLVVWTPTLSWETADMRAVNFFIENGVVYVYYSVDAGKYIGVISHAI